MVHWHLALEEKFGTRRSMQPAEYNLHFNVLVHTMYRYVSYCTEHNLHINVPGTYNVQVCDLHINILGTHNVQVCNHHINVPGTYNVHVCDLHINILGKYNVQVCTH